MPAIDPARLRRQIEELRDSAGEPARLRARILEIFEFYRDRTRRPTAAARAADPGRRSLGVPRPVLRALSRGLDEFLVPEVDLRIALAGELWGTGLAEAQHLAACVAGTLADEAAAEWAAGLAGGCDSRAALKDLAEEGLHALRMQHPERALQIIEQWMRSGDPRTRALAYYSAVPLIADDESEALPQVLRMLESTLADAGGFAQPALQRLVEALARRSPPEAARLLIDELGRAVSGIDELVRLSAPSFPPFQRARLERTLSALRRTGIIPPS